MPVPVEWAEMAGLLSQVDLVERAGGPAVARFDAAAPLTGLVALLPSAFNPPTRAHLHLLASSAERLGATPAALLTTRNVDKAATGASYLQRVEMLLLARSTNPELAVLASNQARIVDQAAVLRTSFPLATFAFVVGHDVLVRLFDSSYYGDMAAELEPFFREHTVIATNRADHPIEEVAEFIAARAGRFAPRISVMVIDDAHAALSSTAARSDAATGDDAPALTAEVAAYVRERGLYRDG